MKQQILREYLVFAKWVSVRRAAQELHLSQSALSKHLSELEKELGLKLIDRSDLNNVSLTLVGREFAKELALSLSIYDAALAKCKEMQCGQKAHLIIQELSQNDAMVRLYGAGSMYERETGRASIEYHMIGRAVDANNAQLPNPADKFDVLSIMRFGESAAWEQQAQDSGLLVVPLYTEPMVVWFEKSNVAASGLDEDATFEDLAPFAIQTTVGNARDYFGEALKQLFELHGVSPRFRPTYTSLSYASSYFLSDYNGGIFCATQGMLHDARMRSRTDLDHRVLRDPCFQVTTYLQADTNNIAAVDFLRFVQRKAERGELPLS